MRYMLAVALSLYAVFVVAQDWQMVQVAEKDRRALAELHAEREAAEARLIHAELVYNTLENKILEEMGTLYPEKQGCEVRFSEGFTHLIVTTSCSAYPRSLSDDIFERYHNDK